MTIKTNSIDTPLGSMIVISDEKTLYLLEFFDCSNLDSKLKKLEKFKGSRIVSGRTNVMDKIEKELDQYFKGELEEFQTPIEMIGTTFQKKVWLELKKIRFGKTCSYLEIAKAMNQTLAIRASASANGANQLAIIIPCHRVINANGAMGGYAGGLDRKKWLLNHESRVSFNSNDHIGRVEK